MNLMTIKIKKEDSFLSCLILLMLTFCSCEDVKLMKMHNQITLFCLKYLIGMSGFVYADVLNWKRKQSKLNSGTLYNAPKSIIENDTLLTLLCEL